jgi:hypothetical protein
MVETKADGVLGKFRIVFLPGKAFFLGGADNPAITYQGRGGVMVKRRNSQDVSRGGHESEKGIKRPGNPGTAGKKNDCSQEQQHEDQGDQPPFLFRLGEAEEFFD